MTRGERQRALEAIAAEISACTRCRLHESRTRAVPGEGNPDTEVMFVGEGPGFNEDREGRPFVGRAGMLLVRLLTSIGWRREDVFITNVVKCRPPGNRDPQPDELAACAPFLRRQVQALDPAVVVTLGRYSLGTFMPGSRIGQAHGTARSVEDGPGTPGTLAFAMYHPAAALRSSEVERVSLEDVARIPGVLVRARAARDAGGRGETAGHVSEPAPAERSDPAGPRRPGETAMAWETAMAGEPAAARIGPGSPGPAGATERAGDGEVDARPTAAPQVEPLSEAGTASIPDRRAAGEPVAADDAQLTLF